MLMMSKIIGKKELDFFEGKMIKKIFFLLGCFIMVSTLGLPDDINNQTGLKSPVFSFIYWVIMPLVDFFGKHAMMFLGCIFIIISILIKKTKN